MYTNWKPPGGFGGGNGSYNRGFGGGGVGPIGGRQFAGGERPGTYGVPRPAADPRGNWMPPNRGAAPPQTGGPLPPYQGGSTSVGAMQPGQGPIGGNPYANGERPGAYGVPPGVFIGQGVANPQLPGQPGVGGMPGGSMSPGQLPPGAGPIGGTPFPGGERPGTYGVPRGYFGFLGGRGY